MLIRNLVLAVLSAGLLSAADCNVLTPNLGQLPSKDFNALLMKSLSEAQGKKPLSLEQMAVLEASHGKSGKCAIRLREYHVHDSDPAASLHIPAGVATRDQMGMPSPVPACP